MIQADYAAYYEDQDFADGDGRRREDIDISLPAITQVRLPRFTEKRVTICVCGQRKSPIVSSCVSCRAALR